jgi:PAS domain S-box-containing protein
MSDNGSERTRRETSWPGKVSLRLRTWPYPVHLALLAALYVSTAEFGLWLHAVGGFATAVWPPTGVALVALVLGGMRLCPAITLGAFLVNAWAGAPLLVAVGMALGNTLEAMLGTLLLSRVVRFRPALDRLRDVVSLLGVAVLSTLVSATVGVTSGWLGGVIPAATAFEAWRTWWLGDMNGDLVAAALLFTWSTELRTPIASRPILEGGGLLLAVVALSLLVFGRPMGVDIVDFSYLFFPVLIWAALRFGPSGASAATALVSTLAIWGTAHGRGPFVGPTFHESVLALQAFMSIVAATILVLAAVVAERARAERRLVTHEAITRLVAEAPSPREAIPRVFQTICESLGWDMGALWHVDREAHVLRYGESWHRPAAELASFMGASRRHTFAAGVGLPGRVWASAEPAWIIDVTADPNFPRAPLAKAAGLQSAFAFPLRLGTDLLGVMEFFSHGRRPPDDDLLRMVATVGGQLGHFLERARAEEARRDGEERFRVMAETASDAILTIDAASTIRFANPAAERLFGYRVAELVGQPLTMLMPPELCDEHRRGMRRYLETGERRVPWDHVEFPGRHHSGTEVALEIAFGEFQQHGERLFAGIIRDITARKRTEDELRRAAALSELTHEAILVLGLDETIRLWNRGAAEMYGWSAEEALGQVAYRLLQTHFPEPFEAIKAELLQRGRWEGDLAQTRRDGSPLVVASRWALQRDVDGQPLAFLEINSDITARRRAEAALEASEAQLRLVTDSAPVFLAHCDAEGRYRFVNRGYAERFGLSRDDVVGRRIPEVLGEEAYASFRAYVERVLAGEPVEFEVEVPYQTLGPRWMHCAYAPERDAAGAVRGHIAVVTDVTARKRMEAQLEASLHEKEVLLREIHHRVKNNFQVICSFLSIQSNFIGSPQLQAIFEECQNRIYAMALVHQNLYQAENLASIDFGAYLESLGAYLLRSYGMDPQRIQLTSTVDHVSLTVDTAIPCGLLVNELISNALRHAFPQGQAGHLWVTLRREVDGQLRLNVRDDGVGLPEGVDFQTTRSFGLQLVRLLAQQLRATMALERHPGTSISLTFVEPAYQTGG